MDALVIDDVTLFDGSDSTPDPKSSVRVVDGVIRSVGPSGSFRAPQGAQVLSVRGRFLMPGLVDLHTHMVTRDAFDFLAKLGGRMRQGDPERFLRWFPAFGVTTVRDIGNYDGIFRLRDQVASSRLVGPRIYAAEKLLEGPRAIWPLSRTFRTPRETIREVRRQAAMGADWVKLYVNVPPSLAGVAIREGRRLGVPVAGHLGSTTARQAAAYGIDSLEHATTLIDDGFLPPKWRAKTPRGSDIAIVRARNRFRWLHADFDGAAMRDLVAKLRRNRVVVSPTMVVHENIFAGPDREFQRYGLRPMPDRWMDAWVGRLKTMLPKGRPLSSGPAIFRRLRTFIGRLRRAGVTVIPSTDAAGWNPYSAPGATLHRELAILKDCGYTNRELLAMATSGAAKALHREWEFGSIAPGRSADLLLLRANPLDDLANLRRIETVFLRGRSHDPARLRS